MSTEVRGHGVMALLAILLAAGVMLMAATSPASATSGRVEIDQTPSGGGPCQDTIPFNGVPTCGGGIPPEGTGLPCIDPALSINLHPGGPSGPAGPVSNGRPPFDTSCLGFPLRPAGQRLPPEISGPMRPARRIVPGSPSPPSEPDIRPWPTRRNATWVI